MTPTSALRPPPGLCARDQPLCGLRAGRSSSAATLAGVGLPFVDEVGSETKTTPPTDHLPPVPRTYQDTRLSIVTMTLYATPGRATSHYLPQTTVHISVKRLRPPLTPKIHSLQTRLRHRRATYSRAVYTRAHKTRHFWHPHLRNSAASTSPTSPPCRTIALAG
jgi:hypothetical protein